jgi:hypothetical protein
LLAIVRVDGHTDTGAHPERLVRKREGLFRPIDDSPRHLKGMRSILLQDELSPGNQEGRPQ